MNSRTKYLSAQRTDPLEIMKIYLKKHMVTAVLCVIAVLFAAIPAGAIPDRPEPPRLVNDLAGVFSESQRAELENILVAFDDSTSNQITVVTVTDLEGYDPSEYATRIGLDWGVGSSEFDNGVVVLVKPKTAESGGKVFIAIGYGLEGAIPDAYAKRIINNEMIPHFMENDYFGGVLSACRTLMKLASGEISEPREEDFGEDDIAAIAMALFFLMIIILVVIAASKGDGNNSGNGGRRIYTGPVITSGHNYGGWSSGGSFGGGFRGGFGGFGGGSFGGGGAGGSW